jgi:hypothetical protein
MREYGMGPVKEPIKVVARYRDGRILRGVTRNLRPEVDETFHVLPCGHAADDPPAEVALSDLKAVFVVKTVAGNPAHQATNDQPAQPGCGVVLEVEFQDGEVIRGQSMTYTTKGAGFWLTPVDPESNNSRMYIVRASTRDIHRQMPQMN